MTITLNLPALPTGSPPSPTASQGMSVFNVENLLSEINTRGFLRPCRFLVSIVMTPAMMAALPTLTAATKQGTVMSFWCEEASLPGAMLDVAPFRRYGYGPVENKAWGAHFADIPLVFRADAEGMVHKFLHSWMRMVVDYNYSDNMQSLNPEAISSTSSPATGSFVQGTPWEVGYKDDYATQVMISVFDDSAGMQAGAGSTYYEVLELGGNPVLQINLRDAFPVAITNAPLAWSARGDYMKIGAILNYFSWFTVSSVA
jgi:hypothetical protein